MKKKFLNFMRRESQRAKKKVLATFALSLALIASITSTVFASTTTDYSSITTAVTGELTVAEVTAVIAAVLAAGMVFVLLWWGARKLINGIVTAFKTGKIKI